MATQRATLRRLLRLAAATRFGREHGFESLADVAAYQRRVPLRTYEAFAAEWLTPFPRLRDATWPGTIRFFANSSGTSGGPTKRLPISAAMLRANRAAAWDVLAWHLRARPDSRVLGGRSLLLGGTTALETLAPGVRAGDLSGIAAATVPAWLRSRLLPPEPVAAMTDWEAKMAALAPLTLEPPSRAAPLVSISGTASWMALFFEAAGRLRPGARLAGLYPELELLVHGGVGFAPYRERFAHWIDGAPILTREVYAASEGFIAVADRGDGEGMRLMLDRGLFFEFVRVADLDSANPDRRWVADAQPGVEYALIVSSNAGLWSYVLGDTVTLVSRTPPRVLVTGRTSWSLSVAGEHLIGAELDAAMTEAAAAVGRILVEYAAAPLPPDAADARAGHLFVVELNGPAETGAFAAALDAALRRRNEDYAAHRGGGFGLRDPAIRLVGAGAFESWMRRRGKLGAQNKVPRVVADAARLEDVGRD